MQSHSITDWIHARRDGDAGAAKKIWNRFFQRLAAVAARHLRSGPARIVEGEDVALDALDSFCRRINGGEFPDLNGRDELWRLLLTMTENKARNQIRHEMTLKRGAGNVRGDSVFYNADASDNAGGFDRFASIEPSPDDIAVMKETLSELLSRLTDEHRNVATIGVVLRFDSSTRRDRGMPGRSHRPRVPRKALGGGQAETPRI